MRGEESLIYEYQRVDHGDLCVGVVSFIYLRIIVGALCVAGSCWMMRANRSGTSITRQRML